MKLTTHLIPVPEFRTNRVITLLPYAITAWTGTTLLLPLRYYLDVENANVSKKTCRLLSLSVAV